MWRLANHLYRAFRNAASYRCPQDIIVPLSTVHNPDDELNRAKKQHKFPTKKFDVNYIIKKYRLSSDCFRKLQNYCLKLSLQQLVLVSYVIKPRISTKVKTDDTAQSQLPAAAPAQKDDKFDLLLKEDEDCMKNLKALTELRDKTTSIIKNEVAVGALETGNLQSGIESLKTSAEAGKNPAAFYNLGICYEHGIGVEKDRAKACDYYLRASHFGHKNALLNLTYLSNQIDFEDNDDAIEDELEMPTNPSPVLSFLLSNLLEGDQMQTKFDDEYESMKFFTCVPN